MRWGDPPRAELFAQGAPVNARVRIVGGGLTGILAALQAHELGARDIEIFERFDHLGGESMPRVRHGAEMREACVFFGGVDDPVRTLLEAHGVEFQAIDLQTVALCPGDLYRDAASGSGLKSVPSGASEGLVDLLPAADVAVLDRQVCWRLGVGPERLQAQAAIALGLVSGSGGSSLPRGGLVGLFNGCRRALLDLGVSIRLHDYVSPRQALGALRGDDVLVWAAGPELLFKALGVAAPRPHPRSVASYVFEVQWNGPAPAVAQNFAAEGSCFRAHTYESGGRTFLTAECVFEDGGDELAYDIHRLMRGFGGDLVLGDLLHATIKPRLKHLQVEDVAHLERLRAAVRQRYGAAVVPGPWGLHDPAQRLQALRTALSEALAPAAGPARATSSGRR
jgi:hypothetical protein